MKGFFFPNKTCFEIILGYHAVTICWSCFAFERTGEPRLMYFLRKEVNEEDRSSRRQEDCVCVTDNGSKTADKCAGAEERCPAVRHVVMQMRYG